MNVVGDGCFGINYKARHNIPIQNTPASGRVFTPLKGTSECAALTLIFNKVL
jgi:hypothetical protein